MSTTGRMIDTGRKGLGRNAPTRRRTQIGGDPRGIDVGPVTRPPFGAPLRRLGATYQRMARAVRYWPLGPSDEREHISMTTAELDLDAARGQHAIDLHVEVPLSGARGPRSDTAGSGWRRRTAATRPS